MKSGVVDLSGVPEDASNQPEVTADTMLLDNSSAGASKIPQSALKGQESGGKKQLKRKRTSIDGNVTGANKESMVMECYQEIDGLFEYYREVSGYRLNLEEGTSSSNNSLLAFWKRAIFHFPSW